MKKKLFVLIFIVSLVSGFTVFADDEINVAINGQAVVFDGQTPVIVEGRTLVPVRGVFEQLGFVVEWNDDLRQATLTNSDYAVVLTVGSVTFTTNGIYYELDVPAQIIGGRTMLPIRAVLESVGFSLDWDANTRTVIVIEGTAPVAPPVVEIPAPPRPVITPGHYMGDLAPTYTASQNKEQHHEEIRRAIIRYSPVGRYLLAQAAENPSFNSATHFIDVHSIHRQNEFLRNVTRVGHYTYHTFNETEFIGQFDAREKHFINGEILTLDYSEENLVHTEESASRILTHLRTFRYSDYVSRGSNLTANVLGAFGLMHEFGAYYYDLTITTDLADYVAEFIKINGFDARDLNHPSVDLFGDYLAGSSPLAFYEFTLWTLEHMLYLKTNNPQQFQMYMENDVFRRTFAYFYQSGLHTIDTVIPVKARLLVEALESHGFTVEADENEYNFVGNFTISVTVGNTIYTLTTGIEPDDAIMLRNEIATPRLSAMLNEMLSGYLLNF